jgi:hypothetical protein
MRTRKRSLALVLASAAALATTACSTTKASTASGRINNAPSSAAASPSQSQAASPKPTGPATPKPTTTITKPANSSRTLGPFGLGALYLGMTPDQIRATHLVSDFDNPTSGNGCTWAQIKSVPKDSTGAEKGAIAISPDLGLIAINAWDGISTPQGIRLGDTYAQVHAAYPKWSGIEGHTGHGLVAAPGNSDAKYRIDIADNGKVLSLTLQTTFQDCYE